VGRRVSSYHSIQDSIDSLNSIWYSHAVGNGWGDIGYNYIIDPLGNIFEGREGGEGVEAGHAWAANRGSVGIALMGCYGSCSDGAPDVMTDATRASLTSLIASLSQRYQIDLQGTSTLTNSCYSFTTANVTGHQSYQTRHKDGLCNTIDGSTLEGATACPGVNVLSELPGIIAAAAAQAPLMPAAGQFVAEYYANATLSGAATISRIEGSGSKLAFNWAAGAPATGIPADNFSVRWRGMITASATGIYTFSAGSDDGSRVYIDNELVVDNWSAHGYLVRTGDIGLTAGDHQIRIEYFDGVADARLTFEYVQKAIPVNSFIGQYWDNGVFQGNPVLIRQDAGINADWGTGTPYAPLGTNYFSIQWDGTIDIVETGIYQFNITADDKMRLWVDDMETPLIDAWIIQSATAYSALKGMTGGTHTVKVRYMENEGDATARLSWAPATSVNLYSAGGLVIKDSSNATLMTVPADQRVKISYADLNSRYYVSSGQLLAQTPNYITATPSGGDPPTVTMDNCTARTSTANEGCSSGYNTFRGIAIVRASDSTRRLNVINRVNLEGYLKGMGETGLNSDMEYTKALMTSARTYALYHYQNGGKHPADFSHVNNTSGDQVYFGYEYEMVTGGNSTLAQAVDATAGLVITHPQSQLANHLIVATYYSQTGDAAQTCGQTKGTDRCTWSVGSWPWIPVNGVPDPWWMKDGVCYRQDNIGRTGAGHGYGMSGRGAYCMATQEGKNFQELIQYYYSGVSVSAYPGGTAGLSLDVGIYALPYSDIAGEKYPDGTLVKTSASGAVYMVQAGKKRLFTSPEIFYSYGFNFGQIVEIPQSDMDSFVAGTNMPYQGALLPDGSLIQESGSYAVYQVESNYRRVFPSAEIFFSYGYNFGSVAGIGAGEMAKYAPGDAMPYRFTPLANGSIIKGSAPSVYLIENGLLRVFPSGEVFLGSGYGWGDIITVSDTHLGYYERGAAAELACALKPVGTVIKGSGPAVYLVSAAGKKKIFPAGEVFLANGYSWGAIQSVADLHLSCYTDDGFVLFHDGALVKDSRPAVYLIEGGLKRIFPSAEVFLLTGHQWGNIIYTPQYVLDMYTAGAVVTYTFVPRANDTLIKGSSPAVYVVSAGGRNYFSNAAVFYSYGYNWGQVTQISDLEIEYYPIQTEVRFKEGSLVKGDASLVYHLESGQKRPIPSVEIFDSYSFHWSDLLVTDDAYLSTYPTGAVLPFAPAVGGGTLDTVPDLTVAP